MTEINNRIVKFDNLKGLAILLIVLGHLTFQRKYAEISFIQSLSFLIGIPLFFFISGYFSKIGPDEPIKAFKRLLIPYLVFCIIWEIFNINYLGKSPNKPLFIDPGFALWFLISLFIMKLILPIFDRFRYPLTISVIFALLIGFLDVDVLGISRVFAYMPIFLIGYYYDEYRRSVYQKLPVVMSNKFTVLLMILAVLLTFAVCLSVPASMIRMKFVYDNFILEDLIVRIIVLIVSTLDILILTRFMTNRELIITQFGVNSMTVYLLHPYLIKISTLYAEPVFTGHPKQIILYILVMAFVICFVLSRDFITKGLNRIFDAFYGIFSAE